jgi:hypothetical protein
MIDLSRSAAIKAESTGAPRRILAVNLFIKHLASGLSQSLMDSSSCGKQVTRFTIGACLRGIQKSPYSIPTGRWSTCLAWMKDRTSSDTMVIMYGKNSGEGIPVL